MKHLVVGMGEVGTAVSSVLSRAHDVYTRDIHNDVDIPGRLDVMDVCIPWSSDFVHTVYDYKADYNPRMIVIHSTVPVGVCDAEGWVHSPIRGRHPNLEEGVSTFVKHFGGHRAKEAALNWKAAGVPTAVHPRASDTEAGKLWELVQYGVQIQVEKAIHSWCAKNDLDFGVVYTAMAHTYNQGYEELGEHHLTRPILKHQSGPIGGHCVVPMSTLLDHPIAEIVRKGWA